MFARVLRNSCWNSPCSLLSGRTVGYRRNTLLFSSTLPRFLSASTARYEGRTNGTETCQEDPSTLSSGDVINHTSGTFQPVDISSLGLGGYWPSGWCQTALEIIYNYVHLPWWGCIIALTVIVRMAIFPMAVKTNVLAAKQALINTETTVVHEKMTMCQTSGDVTGLSEAAAEMIKIHRRHNVHPLSLLSSVLAKVPIFISMICGLKGLTQAPIVGLKTGGTLWFPDLVAPDPLYGLPLLVCVSFLGNVEVSGFTMCNPAITVLKVVLLASMHAPAGCIIIM